MKYTQNLVWEAIYLFIPSYKILKHKKIPIELPHALKEAAGACFIDLMENKGYKSTDEDFAKFLIYLALKELKEDGTIVFGDVNSFWC